MKKSIYTVFAVILALLMSTGCQNENVASTPSAAKTQAAAQTESTVSPADAALSFDPYKDSWKLSDDGTYYSLTHVQYCTNAVDTNYQYMNIYVPAEYFKDGGIVNGYTVDTAPIILENQCGGWMSSTPGGVNTNYIKEGFVFVSCGARSRGAIANVQYDGKAPAPVVDLKAAVRDLKLNADEMPGNEDEIVSIGGSGGGEMSSILGASGNMAQYLPYLYDIGAAGVSYDKATDQYSSTISDAIYGCQCFCPIADLNNADIAYGWMHYNDGVTGETDMFSGETITFTPFKLALQNDMAVAFAQYVNGLGIKDENGRVLTFDKDDKGNLNPRSGSYYSQILQNISDALNKFLKANTAANGTVIVTTQVMSPMPAGATPGGTPSKTFGGAPSRTAAGAMPEAKTMTIVYKSVDDYLTKTYGDYSSWLKKNDNGTYSVTDLDGFVKGTKLIRNKDIPSFDTFHYTAEATAFGTPYEQAVHFSKSVGDLLLANYGKYSTMEGFSDSDVDGYIIESQRKDIQAETYLMNGTTIMLNDAAGKEHSDIAQYWRTRNGTADQHTSFTVAYNLAMSARMAGAKGVDYSLVWAAGHGNVEGAGTDTFIDWVKSICPAARAAD